MLNARYILCIDDDEDDCMLLLEAITHIEKSLEVAIINRGDKAIEFLGNAVKKAQLPRLITLDLNMPGMNGLQTLDLIRAVPALSHIPVLIFSTNVDDLNVVKIEKARLSVMKKPNAVKDYDEIAKTIVYMML